MPKVSVVVPVYGVEDYIERCARSLFEQTIDDIEYIFVNDCTRDKSIDILRSVLNEYPTRQPQVRIINHKQNGGQAAARTTGIINATGDYIIHCDSDDWVDENIYELLYQKAIDTNADIVACGYYNVFKDKKEFVQIKDEGNPHEWLQKDASLWNCWAKLIKLSLIKSHDIYPFEGINYSEDRGINMRAFFFANKIAIINAPLYYYDRTREGSIVNRSKNDVLLIRECERSIDAIYEWFNNKDFDISNVILKHKFNLAQRYLVLKSPSWNDWKRLVPVVTPYVIKNVKSICLKICYLTANNGIYLPVRIYLFLSRICHIL